MTGVGEKRRSRPYQMIMWNVGKEMKDIRECECEPCGNVEKMHTGEGNSKWKKKKKKAGARGSESIRGIFAE